LGDGIQYLDTPKDVLKGFKKGLNDIGVIDLKLASINL
jgi:hypothetical protein